MDLQQPQNSFKTPPKNSARLVTEESIDPRLNDNERLLQKLKHYISKHSECQTTIDFYKIGKVLGKGAFGKVNLAMQILA